MAIEVTLRAWRELPADLPPARRLARAVLSLLTFIRQ
jgi:hypothetical protein